MTGVILKREWAFGGFGSLKGKLAAPQQHIRAAPTRALPPPLGYVNFNNSCEEATTSQDSLNF
ncbi:uncharacterized protein CLUP02_03413 [Colletotrichum lupini]|uniref:Uncharacterized protein n=1 Tax=Colletotrichum lupini TaxID=145971 RepID=A0A9Q8SIS3_9PEZI|nr:uncharacterized protein CLUP02_03413 [Colletotrichum lupini]UQC77940.1 hypothetical protein CLUP02_03413 [Colletotrichum lupini]